MVDQCGGKVISIVGTSEGVLGAWPKSVKVVVAFKAAAAGETVTLCDGDW